MNRFCEESAPELVRNYCRARWGDETFAAPDDAEVEEGQTEEECDVPVKTAFEVDRAEAM